MAIAFRTGSQANTGTTAANSVSPAIPTGTTTGDVMIAFLSFDKGSNVTPVTPAGWTAIASINQTTNIGIKAWSRPWQSGDGAPSLALSAAATAQMVGIVLTYSGVNTTNPVNGFATGTASTATNSTNLPAISPGTLNGMLVGLMACRETTATQTFTGVPTGYTARTTGATTASTFVGGGTCEKAVTSATTLSAATGFTVGTVANFAKIICCLQPAQNGSDITADCVAQKDTTGTGTATTSAFSTNFTNETLVAFCYLSGAASTSTVSGAGLTWTKQAEENADGTAGTAAVWTAFSAGLTGSQSVACTSSGGTDDIGLTVVTYYGGVSNAGTNAVNFSSATANPTVSLTTTQINSLVVGIGVVDGNTSWTAGAGQSIVRNVASMGVNQRNAITASSGTSVTINATTNGFSDWNAAAYELLSVAPTPPSFFPAFNKPVLQAVNRAASF